MFASRLLLLLLSLKAVAQIKAQNEADSPDPGKEEGFKDLITDNKLDEK